MKRFVALTLIVALMVITAGAVRTPAQNYYGYDVDADYGGELLDEPLWEINFFLDGRLMYATIAEESLINRTQDVIGEMMIEEWCGCQTESECFYDEQLINVYYTKGE